MKQKNLLLLFTLFLGLSIFTSCSDDDENILVITFNGALKEAESEFKTDKGELDKDHSFPSYNLYHTTFSDAKDLLTLTHSYTPEYGFAGGFTYTNKTDVTTPGSTNISAITGKGKYGETYLTAATGQKTAITLQNPKNYSFKEIWVTNATYAYLAMKEGKDNNEGKDSFVNQFKEGDYFKLIITGYDAKGQKIGSQDFYLADYRDKKTEIINEWKQIDLSAFHNATHLEFTIDGTDKGDHGLNTPKYFCVDGITLIEK